MSALPTQGLNALRYLALNGNSKLRQFPEVRTLPSLQTAIMHFPFHCCLFDIKPTQLQRQTAVVPQGDFSAGTFVTIPDFFKELNGSFGHVWAPAHKPKHRVDISYTAPALEFCSPQPETALQCQRDLFQSWLRAVVWLVVIFTFVSNGTAVLLLLRKTMNNMRLLVVQVAFGNICIGIYLVCLAAIDSSTKGQLYLNVHKWQFSSMIQAAGFFAMFGTLLTYPTLTLIALQHYLAIHFHMKDANVDSVVCRKHLGIVLLFIWALAAILATLPLVGVNDYHDAYLLALPFEKVSTTDKGYIGFILVFITLCVLTMITSYVLLFIKVRNSAIRQSDDFKAAWQMAVLTSVILVCWAPAAIIGISATLTGDHLVSLKTVQAFVLFVFPFHACINPILYLLMTYSLGGRLIAALQAIPNKVRQVRRSSSDANIQLSSHSTVHSYSAQAQYSTSNADSILAASLSTPASVPEGGHMTTSISTGVLMNHDANSRETSEESKSPV